MQNWLTDLLTPTTRSSKRLKLSDNPSTPQSADTPTKRRSKRPVTYGSNRKRKLEEVDGEPTPVAKANGNENGSTPAIEASEDEGEPSGPSFVDSAYHSTTPTQEASPKEQHSPIASPSRGLSERASPEPDQRQTNGHDIPLSKRQGRRTTQRTETPQQKRRKTEKELNDDTIEVLAQEAQRAEEPAQELERLNEGEPELQRDESPEATPQALRSSGRLRKKSRRAEELEEAKKLTATMGTEPGNSSPLGRTPTRGKAAKARKLGERTKNGVELPETPSKKPKSPASGLTASGKKRGRPRKNPEPTLEPEATVAVADGSADMLFDGLPEPEPGSEEMLLGEEGAPDADAIDSDELPADSSLESIDEAVKILQDPKNQKHVERLKEEVLKNLCGKSRIPLTARDHEYQRVTQLVTQTVEAGEGNSMLIIGARGAAKSNLVETVVSEIGQQHSDDFYVVRLNGFVQTDDKLALREIWRQLGKELEGEDDMTSNRGSYAEILATLLALLSEPGAENDSEGRSKAVIFILDEFEKFAAHPRQTLLYNLFDIAQSRKAPIAVLGLTTRFDVVESLEKRVKSRFSHRHIYLPLPKTFAEFLEICKVALLAHPPGVSLIPSFPWDRLDLPPHDPDGQTFLSAWTTYATALLATPPLRRLLEHIYHTDKSISAFLSLALLPLTTLSPASLPTAASFAAPRTALLPPRASKLALLPDLAELELALLIAAARLDVVLDADACTFELARAEYRGLAERLRATASVAGTPTVGSPLGASRGGTLGGGGARRPWGREAALRAWETLVAMELVVPAVGGGAEGGGVRGGGGAEGGRARLWKVDVGLEDIGESEAEMSAAMRRWCKEI